MNTLFEGANPVRKIERVLLSAETTLALVESLSPMNFEAEVARLTAGFRCGEVVAPAFRYASSKERAARAAGAESFIFAVRRALDTPLPDVDRELLELLWERAHELLLEVELLRRCDTSSVRELSAERFRLSSDETEKARALSLDWLTSEGEPDEEQPRSLSAQLSAFCRQSEMGAQIVVVERELAAIAAVGDQTLYVRKGSRATSRQAQRIWAHEVEGHLLPRLSAREEAPPLLLGTPGCSVDEEGRAILIEERAGVLDGGRKQELARRFLIARAVSIDGVAAGLEVVRDFLGNSADASEVARSLCRVARGGGLCRELIYLPAYLRVKEAFAKNPACERHFRRGRASVGALPFFERVFGERGQS